MTASDKGRLQQFLAVAFTLVMVVSVFSVGFVGGLGTASAQTGGTADGLLVDETPAGADLNITDSTSDVQLTGVSADLNSNNIEVDSDGSITVNPSNAGRNQFSGLTVTPNRIGVADDNLATGLDGSITEVDVEGTATPVVVIEYAPQSDFSQIDDVNGTDDFTVIGNDTALPDDITGGTTSDRIVAYSVDNDDFDGNTTELANTTSFDDTISAIVGSSESDLQNENVDDFRIGAGTFGNGDVDVNALQISSNAVTGETIHSETITLNDGTTNRFFNSITNASDEASDGDTIEIIGGRYSDLEDDPIVLSNNELTVTGIGTTGAGATNVDTNVDITGNNVTIEGFKINDADTGGNGIVNVTGANPTIQQLEVNQEANDDTGISITSGASSVVTTVDNVRVTANSQRVSTGSTGLALDTNAGENVVVTNSRFEDHEIQIAGNANIDEGTFLSNFENTGAQSAVARNASGAVIGNAIYGSINRADAENPVDGSIEVSQGSYTHGTAVNITTNNVSVTETDGSAIVNNELEISGSAGDVVVTGFDLNANAASTTAATNLNSLTFDQTEAGEFDVGATAGSVTNATFTGTEIGAGGAPGDYAVAVSDTVAVDAATGDDFTLNGSSAVDVRNAEGASFTLDSTGDVRVNQTSSTGAVEIGSGASTPADVIITGGDANNYNIADVAGDVTVTGSATTGGGIDVARSAADVRVNNADVTLDASSEIGVDVTASGLDDEVISINNTDVNGGSTSATGINLTNVDASATAAYTIDDNNLTNFGDGVGVNITEQPSTGREANISISDNAIAGGSNFIGVQANLSAAEDVAIVGNEIVGADVSGGADSVGIKFVEAPDFGGGFLGGGTGAEFNNNTITGHARLIEDSSSGAAPPIRSEGYTRIINELDNDFGTLVIGENGDFGATYGDDLQINDGTGGVVYLPGSIDQAVDLVGDSPNVESADLQVNETDVTVSSAISSTPDKYDDDPVVFPNADDITVTGESETVEAETTFEITGGDQRNNHNIRSLTIDSAGTAISVSTTKAQSEFTDLNVTATGTGLDVDPDGTDVNVIEVRDSDFDVGGDGIDFAGTSDDRDGFVIQNVTVDGDGIGTGGTGLDLSGVEKPGKAGLPVNLTVTNTSVGFFATQVAVGDDIPADADDFRNDRTTASVTIQDNEFDQAIRVVDSGTLADDDLYGSVIAADAAASDGDTIDVLDVTSGAPTRYNHNLEVTLSTPNVRLSGPATTTPERTDTDTVRIQDPIRATDTNATVEGLVVEGGDGSPVLNNTKYGATADAGETTRTIVGADAGVDLTVKNVNITAGLDSSYTGPRPVGIGAASDGSSATLDIDSVFVGGAGSDIGTGVVAQENVELLLSSSQLRAGANGVDASGNLVSEGYGVLAGPGTSPTISQVDIDGFDADGINTLATNFQASGVDVTNNNAASADSGVGGVATNADIGSPATEYIFTGTNVSANDGDGVRLTGVGLDADAVTVSDNTNAGVNVTGDDVVIDETSTISANGGTGAVLDVTTATVADSNVSANDAGVDIEATDATVENTTLNTNDGDGVVVAAETVDITDNTIQQNDAGVVVDVTDSANSTVTLNTLANNTQGLVIGNGAAELTVTGNTINSTTTAIQNTDDTTLDATLNFFGTDLGPAAGADVTDNVVYDPFLTEDKTSTTTAEIAETTDFAHDVIVPAPEAGETRTFTSVGFPAEPAAPSPTDPVPEVADYFSTNASKIYALENGSFTTVEPDTPIEAFDAFVVENRGTNGDRVVSIEYQDDPGPGEVVDNANEFQEGINFVAPQQAGQVDEVLFPGGDTDAVVQPFPAGENLYGAASADQVRDQFVTVDSAQQVSTNFRSGAGDATVHPHVGYIVIVNEEANENLTVTESIPVPDGPTADEIANRTDADTNTITNVNTGDTYTDIQIALDEARDGATLRLGPGTYESAADPALVREDDLTITGAGATSVIDSNVTVAGDNVEFRAVTIVGELTTNGSDFRSQDVDVNANSPGDVFINGDGASLTDIDIEKDLNLNGADARVSSSSSSNITVAGDGASLTDVDVEEDITVNGADASVSNTNAGGTVNLSANNTQLSDTTADGGVTVDDNVDQNTVTISGDSSAPDEQAVIDGESGSFDTIQAAVDNASADDRVLVGAGTFNESVTVDVEGLTLEGPNAGIAGDSDERGSEAIITGGSDDTPGLRVANDSVTVDGLQIENPGQDGVRFGPDTVPSEATIQNNVITNIAGAEFAKTQSAANGIQFQFASGVPNSETASNIRILDNEISDVSAPDNTGELTATGINVLPRGNDIDGLEIDGNTISEIEPGTGNPGEARGIIVDTQKDDPDRNSASADAAGAVSGLSINDNEFTNLAGDDVAAIALFEDFRISPRVGPENFTITNNEISNLDGTAEAAVFIGGYETLGADHEVSQNVFRDGTVQRFSGEQLGFDPNAADALNLVDNTFTSTDTEVYVIDGTTSDNLDAVLADNTFDADVSVVGDTAIVPTPGEGEAVTEAGEVFDGDNAIQNAVDAANAGVLVGPGTFTESVTVNTDGLTLEGPNAGIDGDSGERGAEATITEGVDVRASTVTLDGLEVRNPGEQGAADPTDFAGAVGVNIQTTETDVTVENTVLTDIGTNDDDANPIGIYAPDGTTGLTVSNNLITGLEGTDEDEGAVQAVLVDESGTAITDVSVTDNTITNLLDTRSTVAVRFNGNVSGSISGNEISDLNTEGTIPGSGGEPGGFTQVIALQQGGASETGPSDVTIADNDISNIETTTDDNFAPPFHIIVGENADAGTISIENNDFSADSPDTDVYVGDATGELDLNAILNDQGNTFDPDGQVSGGGDSIVPEGQQLQQAS